MTFAALRRVGVTALTASRLDLACRLLWNAASCLSPSVQGHGIVSAQADALEGVRTGFVASA